MHMTPLEALVREGFGAIGTTPSEDVVAQFMVYIRELRRWNETINLTGYTREREIIGKLLVDSLAWTKAVGQAPPGQACPWRPVRPGGQGHTSCAMLDIGSGAGFPGIPISIVSPQHGMTLLEPNLKKVAFLHHLTGLLGLTNVRVESSSVEQFARQQDVHGKFDWVLMKALRLSVGLPYVSSLLSVSGHCALWRAHPVAVDLNPDEFSVIREMPYELPFGFGKRQLSIVGRRQ